MLQPNKLGQIVILNGTPRSGKSSIAAVIQDSFDGVWMNLGVDRFKEMIPEKYQPGIGLRPGGERPDLEPLIKTLYQTMYESIALLSRSKLNVVVDVGHHDSYSESLQILSNAAQILKGLPVLFVGVRCPIDVVMERRQATWGTSYNEDSSIPKPIHLWQQAVHEPGIYDLEVDTSILSSEKCADLIRARIEKASPATAFQQLASMARE